MDGINEFLSQGVHCACFAFALTGFTLIAFDRDGKRSPVAHIMVLASVACLFATVAAKSGGAGPATLLPAAFCCLAACGFAVWCDLPRFRDIFTPALFLVGAGLAYSCSYFPTEAVGHCSSVMACCVAIIFARGFLDAGIGRLSAKASGFGLTSVLLCCAALALSYIHVGFAYLDPTTQFALGLLELAKVSMVVALSGFLAVKSDALSAGALGAAAPLVVIAIALQVIASLAGEPGAAAVICSTIVVAVALCVERNGIALAGAMMTCFYMAMAVLVFSSLPACEELAAWVDPGYVAEVAVSSQDRLGWHDGNGKNVLAFALLALSALASFAAAAKRAASSLVSASFERNVIVSGTCLILAQSVVCASGKFGILPIVDASMPFASQGWPFIGWMLLIGLMAAVLSNGEKQEAPCP